MNAALFEVLPDCEILSSRIFKAPREMVFRAWTEPDILKEWWGPAGFTNTFHEFDLRPGGKWRFIMHGPDKGHYSNECVFLRIEPPVFIAWDRLSQPLFRVVVSFDEIDNSNTDLSFRMQFDSKAACDKIRSFAPEKNEENFDRLEAVLQKLQRSISL
jgi:uncharacterized protein YndB with AHSA1/START domain